MHVYDVSFLFVAVVAVEKSQPWKQSQENKMGKEKGQKKREKTVYPL